MIKPRPTDEEFEELKRQRDEKLKQAISKVYEEWGWDPPQACAHVSHAGECYCDCPNGPCQHVWDGPEYREEGMSSVTCSRCGSICAYHDMRVGP